MTTPRYFSQFPNINYGVSMNRSGVIDFIQIKDFFNHLILRDFEFSRRTILSPYMIKNGERPDQISYEQYGDEQYYWLILHINEVVDFYNEWPMSQYNLDRYITDKYGTIGGEDVHHYETLEVKDTKGNVLLPGRGGPGPDRGGLGKSGLVVSEDYTFTYPSEPGSNFYITKSGSVGTNAACTPITNRQYEYDLNEDKSQIWLLDGKYISDIEREISKYSGKLTNLNSELDVSDYE